MGAVTAALPGAKKNGLKDKAYVSRTLRLALLAPEIVHAILTGKLEKSIPQRMFRQEFPIRWSAQKKFFGIE